MEEKNNTSFTEEQNEDSLMKEETNSVPSENNFPTDSVDVGDDKQKQVLYIGIAFIIIISILVAGYFFLLNKQEAEISQYDFNINTFKVGNAQYGEADLLRRQDDTEGAILIYEQVLEEIEGDDTINKNTKGQLMFDIAISYTLTDPVKSVSILKEIVASEEYTDNYLKAEAVNAIGELYKTNPEPALLSVIFIGEPYSDFLSIGDVDLSFLNLFEYALTFSPNGFAALRAADYYTNLAVHIFSDLETLRQESGSSETPQLNEELGEYLIKIQNNFRIADNYVEDIRSANTLDGRVPKLLSKKAVVLGKLTPRPNTNAAFKPFDPTWTSEEVIRLFEESREEAQRQNRTDLEAVAVYNHAVFLVLRFGGERNEEARQLVSFFFESKVNRSWLDTLFENMKKDDPDTSIFGMMVFRSSSALAGIDPEFKKAMEEAGIEIHQF